MLPSGIVAVVPKLFLCFVVVHLEMRQLFFVLLGSQVAQLADNLLNAFVRVVCVAPALREDTFHLLGLVHVVQDSWGLDLAIA